MHQKIETQQSPLRRLRLYLVQFEFGRFVLVGIWNTLSGYMVFALFNFIFSRQFPTYGYIAAAACSSLINITIAFLGYKLFVFKTKGNYLREWFRTLCVYAAGIVASLLLLPCVVYIMTDLYGMAHSMATYTGAFILMLLSALWNFFANKNFSFKPKRATTKPSTTTDEA